MSTQPETTFTETEVNLIIDEAIRVHVNEMFRAALPRAVSYDFPEENTRMVLLREDLYMTILASIPDDATPPRSLEEIRRDIAKAQEENRASGNLPS